VTTFNMCSYPSYWHSSNPKAIILFYIQAHILKKKNCCHTPNISHPVLLLAGFTEASSPPQH